VSNAELSPLAENTLLLCGRFSSTELTSPLTAKELNHLESILQENELSLTDITDPSALESVEIDERDTELVRHRVPRLLERGAAMAAALERWHQRGLWVIDRTDPDYPQRWIFRLGDGTPPLLYGSGRKALLNRKAPSVAITGSRNFDDGAEAFLDAFCRVLAHSDIAVASGGARGTDLTAIASVIRYGGTAISVLPGNLQRLTTGHDVRRWIVEDQLVLCSPYYPGARFTVGNAMGRNRLIYCLADIGLIVAAEAGSGGTWAGATEALQRDWLPIYARQTTSAPSGNAALLKHGAHPLDESLVDDADQLSSWLTEQIQHSQQQPEPHITKQLDLFSDSVE
jgi:predicted Rossmann fold nucleotide-binding protein DprA/Smf involved in DNA uptake